MKVLPPPRVIPPWQAAVVGFVVGLLVAPIYFKWIYPFLYHLVLPL